MPVRITVELTAEPPGALPPPQTGPAVNAAFLSAVRRSQPELARRLHDSAPPRPFALTPLLDERDRPPTSESARTRFEVGVLVDDLFASVYAALLEDEPWRVGGTTYRRAGTEVTALATYDDLVAAAKPVRSWGFRVLTPTAFGTAKEEGARRQRIFPEPEWVFRTLFDRWHAFVDDPGLCLPETVPRAVEEHFEVVEYDLRSSAYLVKAGVPALRGCVGSVRYALAEPDGVPADARRALDSLAAFACFAGIGNRTTVGMGHVVAAPAPRYRKERRARPRPHAGPTPPL